MTKGRNGNQTFSAHGGTETVFSPSTSVSPVSIVPPLLHTHSFSYTLFFQDKLEKTGSLPKSSALLDIGQYWTAKYLIRSVPCARVWIKRNT